MLSCHIATIFGASRADVCLVDGGTAFFRGERGGYPVGACGHFGALPLGDGWEHDRLLRWLCLVDFFIGQELVLHFVSVNVGQVMEDIFAEIRCNLVRLLKTTMELLCLI